MYKEEDRKLALAPILAAMAERAGRKGTGFHMPGHQGGRGQWPAFSKLLAERGQALDLTELPGLDNLAAPSGCIEKSQEAMARLAGSEKVFYLVNGATAGLEAAMLAMSDADTPAIFPSHCHIAIYQGLILTGGRPVILPCRVDEEWGLPLGIDMAEAGAYFGREAGADADADSGVGLDCDAAPASGAGHGRDPGSGSLLGPEKALWITVNPTYNGLMADLPREKAFLDQRPGWSWLADEAHGAHLPFVSVNARGKGEQRPLSALAWRARAVVQSVHKTGCGFTQTALLHCNLPRLSGRLRQAVNMLQSTSPSYMLLGSLDAWQAWLQTEGRQKLRETAELARRLAGRISGLGGYRLWADEVPDSCIIDPRKITVSSGELGLDGFSLAGILREKYGIDTELAAPEYVLFMVNLGHEERDCARLVKALKEIQESRRSLTSAPDIQRKRLAEREERKKLLACFYPSGKQAWSKQAWRKQPWQPLLTPREVFFRARKKIPLEDAAGRIAAAPLVPYPPGIPLVYPGSIITKEAIGGLKAWLKAGQSCTGLEIEGNRVFAEVLEEEQQI